MTDKKEVAQTLKDAVKTLYQDEKCAEMGWETDKPTVIIVLRELVAELQYYQFCREEGVEDMVLDARAILDVCDELENL
jgi:hypothetical protein